MLDLALIVENVISILLPLGVPIIILLVLATELGQWYDEHPDPPPEAFGQEGER
jgi:hypothetical protein